VRFRRFDDAHLPELMAWFTDATSCRLWGGVEFRFPFTEATFREDAKLAMLPNWSLVAGDDRLAAFGQCYLRAGRCHFGRLAVSPAMRGRGLGSLLIERLAEWGLREFGVHEQSLFVCQDNPDAVRLYRRLGFVVIPYPEPSHAIGSHDYMVKS
jgi:ribosomal protein S18 acetylase RimI-like enzyme